MQPLENFRVVYDARAAGFAWPFDGWWVVALLVVVGGLRSRWSERRFERWLGAAVAGLALGLGTLIQVSEYRAYRELVDALNTGRFDRVEGTVTDFAPGRPDNHPPERFAVAAHEYVYSPYLQSSGFNQVSAAGGPVRAGLHVRIADVRGVIARLEIRD